MRIIISIVCLAAIAYGAEVDLRVLNELGVKGVKAERQAAPVLNPCTSECTVNLTEWWRKDNYGQNIQPGGNYNCDEQLQSNEIWFRINGPAGNRIRNTCVPSFSCGGHGGFWTDAPMPTQIGRLTKVAIYGSWDDNCSWYRWAVSEPLSVIKCSHVDGDYVYKLQGTESCHWNICTMD